jgi:hypothetical protein
MKKFYSLLIAMTLVFSVSCFLQDEEDEAAPVGSGTFEATVSYSGTTKTWGSYDTANPGNMKNYIYLYSEIGQRSDTPAPVYEGSSATNDSTITINNIAPGNYYVVVCYHYRAADPITLASPALSKDNPYEIYNGSSGTQAYTSGTTVSITNNNTTSLSIEFDDTWDMGTASGGRYFMP